MNLGKAKGWNLKDKGKESLRRAKQEPTQACKHSFFLSYI